jgi:hypothetical protein
MRYEHEGKISCIGKIRNAHKIFIRNSRGLPRLKCVDNEEIYAGGARCENVVDHVSPAEDRTHWRDVVNAKLKLQFPQRADSFLTKSVTTQF